jgi:hypothetical protein
MNTKTRWAPALAALAFLAVTSPVLAKNGNNGHGNGHGNGRDRGQGNGHSNEHGGGAKGSPTPIAGLGIMALGAIGYGTRRLRKQKQP